MNITHARIWNPRTLAAATATFCIAWFAGCSDPADNVPKSSASAPQEAKGTNSAAKPFRVLPDSKVTFVGSKVTGKHEGGFTNVTGRILVDQGRIVAAEEIVIDMQSIWSDDERLTGHLKSPDFFDVAQFPKATFTTTTIEPATDGHKVTGNLTLHGVTKSISFPAKLKAEPSSATVEAEFAINRREFNINYPGKPNDLIRDQVVIKLDIKAAPQDAKSGA